MNFVGMFMFIAVGGTALHYWHGYMAEHRYIHVATERQVKYNFLRCILNQIYSLFGF